MRRTIVSAAIPLDTRKPGVKTVSNKAAFDNDETALAAPVEGGRACPFPPDLIAVHGPWGNRRPRRTLGSTGVISADVVERV